jgi:hypothetical protein
LKNVAIRFCSFKHSEKEILVSGENRAESIDRKMNDGVRLSIRFLFDNEEEITRTPGGETKKRQLGGVAVFV